MKKNPLNRRELIKKSLAGTALLASAGIVACSKKEEVATANTEVDTPAAANDTEAKAEYISEDNQMAKSLGYKENADSVDTSLRVDKGDSPGATQYCNNCQFKVAEEGNEEGLGCQLFPGKLVRSKGWCKSWSKAQS